MSTDLVRKYVQAIRDKLVERGLKIATAESISCGNVQAALGSLSGASAFFVGGVCCYTLEQKVALLGVNRDLAAECDCVSEQVAIEMANGCLDMFGADIAVATTGYAEPNDALGVESPFAYICVARKTASGRETSSAVVRLGRNWGNRQEVQRVVAKDALGTVALSLGIATWELEENGSAS